MQPKLIPELDVSDLQSSLSFYVKTIGFKIVYERAEERFAFIDLDGASIMLEEAQGPGRRFRTALLEKPFGRGVNFQIQVTDVNALYKQLTDVSAEIVIPLEEKWHRSAQHELGNLQFVVADPDGYLLRFFTDLGIRPHQG